MKPVLDISKEGKLSPSVEDMLIFLCIRHADLHLYFEVPYLVDDRLSHSLDVQKPCRRKRSQDI